LLVQQQFAPPLQMDHLRLGKNGQQSSEGVEREVSVPPLRAVDRPGAVCAGSVTPREVTSICIQSSHGIRSSAHHLVRRSTKECFRAAFGIRNFNPSDCCITHGALCCKYSGCLLLSHQGVSREWDP
jgi:hypothetical protein